MEDGEDAVKEAKRNLPLFGGASDKRGRFPHEGDVPHHVRVSKSHDRDRGP